MSKKFRITTPFDPVVLGKLGSTYGIHGWLRVFSYTEEAESIFHYQPWFIKRVNEWQMISLESWKRHNRNLIIKIMDIEDRELAMFLTNNEIFIDSSQLLNLENGEYYWKDLIGCRVFTTLGYHLGTVINLIETGSNDVLVVKANLKDAFGIKERLVPFLNGQVIKNVDLATRIIKVEWNPRF
ncbi:Ribosome maturation factor RimM [Candidatus Gullanella endobia]|uniref:Ribosome maturation factor RimM n=1 Tax=Candidatus Gullanella endobia TaxID=1070130 RepID=A0A143WQN3_9ENTR|nr:ribosome maturation factor RimM [Candidatus Gullanella endobia]CUX96055.1 Ribosome maturation factor RimM [Candidatus Gullanella endobia]